MKPRLSFTQSLAFKIGLTIVLAEVLVLTLTGVLYVNNFSGEIDKRIVGQVQLPGKFMSAGLLKLESIADNKIMRDIVGEELINGLVVSTNGRVFFSLHSEDVGKSIGDIGPIETGFLQEKTVTSNVLRRTGKIISVSPIFGTDGRTLRFYVYVEASTLAFQQQQNDLIRTFVLGSLLTIALTSLILYAAFASTIVSRIRSLLQVLKKAETGDLAIRVVGQISNDEIGALQRGVNSMIGELQDMVTTLEQRVQQRTRDLDLARQAAESASNAKSVFLSNMSHELRTPLNMVIGYASSMLNMPQMYNNQALPTIFQSDILLIQENGKYLLGLINDMLDLSKIEASKLTLDMQCVNLTELFRGVLASALGLIKDKPLQLSPDFPDHLPLVWGDPVRIRQILLNLLSNAIKFTPSGAVTLMSRADGDKVSISVIDTGVGIPESAIHTIFDRYEQIKNQVDAKHSGTGLGLDISQRLCQMHNAKLTVVSKVGRGSTFSFVLTCATPAQIATNQPLVSPVKDSSFKLLKHDTDLSIIRQVILAEDNSQLRITLRQALETAGHVVIETVDADQVIEFTTSLLPDLVIANTVLSGTGLVSKLEALQQQPEYEHIPVLLLKKEQEALSCKLPNATILNLPVNAALVVSTAQRIFSAFTH